MGKKDSKSRTQDPVITKQISYWKSKEDHPRQPSFERTRTFIEIKQEKKKINSLIETPYGSKTIRLPLFHQSLHPLGPLK